MSRRWAWGLLTAYVLAASIVLLVPVGYFEIVVAIWTWIGDVVGWRGFGPGWIEFFANVLMFLPLGFLLTILLRHHWYGVALALALSAGAELVQILIPARFPSLRDVIANTLGAAIGAALAWLLVLRREKRRTERRVSAEQRES